MGGLATVGLAAGGLLAFKSGALRGAMHESIMRAGAYRRGVITEMNQSLRRYSEQEGLGGFGKSVKELFKGDRDAARKHMQEFVESFTDMSAFHDGMAAHQKRVQELMSSKLVDHHLESRMLMSSATRMEEELSQEGFHSNIIHEARAKLNQHIIKEGHLDPKEQALMMKQTGVRHATIQDLLNAGEKLDQSFLDQGKELYRQATGKAENFLTSRADRNIMVDMNGNLADLRDFRKSFIGFMESLTTDFTIPLIKINPLRMFYMDQFFSSLEKPHFHITLPTQRNPAITGHSGAADNTHLFIGGKIFEMGKGEDGVMKQLDGDFFLADAQKGPLARLMRNMSGITISSYNKPEANAPFWTRARYNLQSLLGIGFQDEPAGQFDFFDMTSWSTGLVNKITNRFKFADLQLKDEYLKDAFGDNAKFFFMRKSKKIGEVGTKEYLAQFTAGRHNIQEATFSSVFPYGFFERLNATLNQVNLGLPSDDLGSGLSIFKNLMLKRVAPVWAGYEMWEYLNYESDNLTDEQLSDRIAKTYANTSVEFAKMRDKLGITNWAKSIRPLLVGGDQLAEFPVFGKFVNLDDTAEETADEWSKGEVAVRKGRWWPLGNTPYAGGKIDYFQPNWVRRVLADAKFSDAQYGSREEYFQNSWMPTPRHPLAPIRHFITDPYHWEKKHYDDRPYMVTGGIPELENMPLIGPALNTTIGRVLKPTKRMHQEYWSELPQEQQPGDVAGFDVADAPVTQEIVNAMTTIPGFTGVAPVGAGAKHQQRVQPAIAAYVTPSGQVQVINATDYGKIKKVQAHLKEISPARSPELKVQSIRDPDDAVPLQSPISPAAMSQVLGNLHYNASEMGGFYGFMGVSLTGEIGTQKPVWQSSHDMTSYSRAFWDLDIGGYGGDANEIFRRFVPKDRKVQKVNPIKNTMPDWLPGSEYFTDFQHGDPYAKIKKGEIRLPGEAYERMYNIRPTENGEHHGDQYNAIDRFRILSDVAPYSRQYRDLESQFKFMELKDPQKKEIQRIKKRTSDRKERLRLYPYKFTTSNLQNEFVTVDQVIDQNTFTTLEHPDNPIRFAGLRVPTGKDDPIALKAKEVIGHAVRPGKRIKIAYDADTPNMIKDDTYHTIQSVVYDAKNRNMNQYLLHQGLAKEKENDFSPAAVHARFSEHQISFGSFWEKFAHLDTILHTKFLQVRSPLESYERRETYGKDWQEWTDPVQDYLIPGIQNGMVHHPLFAIAAGAFMGAAFGSLKAGDIGYDGTKVMARYGKVVGGVIGASVMGAAVMYKSLYEHIKNEAWIPERRKKERDTEEYFDVIKYLKYNKLYQEYASMALKKEHFDVDAYLKENKKEGEDRKQRKNALEQAKRQIYTSKPADWSNIQAMLKTLGIEAADRADAMKQLNAEINSITLHRELQPLSPIAARAILYKQATKKTLYGYEAGDPMADVLSALPKKDRDYLIPFIESPEEERPRILAVVPNYMKRILQSAWGQQPDKKQELQEFFAKHPLPGKKWKGWDEGVSIDDIKVKFVDRAGLDPSEFDIWQQDKQRAAMLDVPVPNVFKGKETANSYASKIRDILHGSGLDGVNVEVVESNRRGIHVDLDMDHDRRKDFQRVVNTQGQYIM